MNHTRTLTRVAAACLFALLSMASKLQAQTRYLLSFPNLNGHLMEVEARFEGPLGREETVNMPVWTPGSYLIREYSKNMETLAAFDAADQPLPFERVDKAGWKVKCGGKPFKVRYRMYCNELAIRNAHVDASHAFFTPAAVLVYLRALAEQPHTIQFNLPEAWKTVSTSLPSSGKWEYMAANLDQVMDSPFEIGTHTEQGFDVDGVRYRMATYPATLKYTDQQLADISDIVHQANRIFGDEAPPLKEYLFITHLNGGGGGLEHMYGSVLQGNPAMITDAEIFKGHLSLVGHEYFHIWNVKRIKPRRLGPFDYQQENYTNTLWFAEGITSYYDDLLVARSGKYTRDEYLNILAANINNNGSLPGWQVQTLEQSSLEAWIKYYRPNENSANATTAYYGHGSVVGWAMDMRIRALSKGTKNLDDLMQLLWQAAKADPNFYADRAAISNALTAVCGSEQSIWLENLVAKNNYPEIEQLALDAGFLPVDHRKDKFWPDLGLGQQRAAGDRIIASVIFRNGAAEKAGVTYGDQLVSLDGRKLTEPIKADELPYTEGQAVKLEVLRQGQPMTFTLNVQPSPRMRWQLGLPKKMPKNLKGWIDKK